jgi:hypothetical protein
MPPLSADDLYQAFDRVRENEGCAGADGITIHAFAQRLHRHIPYLLLRVQQDRYRPYPLLKIVVEKRPGAPEPGVRTLFVPAVRDRVRQTAAARRLSRSFEEEFLECSYGYRPGRSVDRAIARIRKCRELGDTFVADADIATFFERVDQDLLLMFLLRLWVHCQSWDGAHVRPVRRGIPQYYAAVRLPIAVRVGLIAHRLLPPFRPSPAAENHRVSVLACPEGPQFPCMPGVYASAVPATHERRNSRHRVAFRFA